MKNSDQQLRLIANRIKPFVGNNLKSHLDPRAIDELVHVENLLLNARIEVVFGSGPSELLLSDSRATYRIVVPPQNSVEFSYWHVKEVHDEYLLCRSWNGKTEGSKDVKVAKPGELRSSVIQETLPDGTALTFSAWAAAIQQRHAEGSDGTSEDQLITPRYLIADEVTNSHSIIRAIRTKTFAEDEDGKSISLEDTNKAGRAFASPE